MPTTRIAASSAMVLIIAMNSLPFTCLLHRLIIAGLLVDKHYVNNTYYHLGVSRSECYNPLDIVKWISPISEVENETQP